MEFTIDLQRSDIEMAVFAACYQKGDPKATKNLEQTVTQCVNQLWKKRGDLLNKRRVNRSRQSGSSKHGDDESVVSASDAGTEPLAEAIVARWDFARKVATLDLEGATRRHPKCLPTAAVS